MAGVHRLQHVERFLAADLADDDAVGAHTQGVDQQLALPDGALAFDVRRPRLEAHHVLLVQLQFGRVLDRDDALALRDEAGQHVEERRLAGAGAAADQHVQACAGRSSRGTRASAGSSTGWRRGRSAFSRSAGKRRIESSGPSTASGGMIALTREPSGRRASTIGELSSMRRPTPLTMRSMTRSRCLSSWNVVGSLLERARALDEDLLIGVDQDVADRRVAQQRLERSEAEDLVDDVAEDRVALGHADRRALLGDQLEEQRPDLRFGADALGRRELLEIQPLSSLRWTLPPVRCTAPAVRRHAGAAARLRASADGRDG